MWIHNHFAALFLEENLSPVDLWERLYGVFARDRIMEECAPLLEFLAYQLLGSDRSNEAAFPELSQPNANAAFVRHRQAIIDLLSPSTSTTSGNPTIGGDTSGLSPADFRSLVEALRFGNSTATSVPKTGLTTEKRWGLTLDTILKYCHVSNVEDLCGLCSKYN